MIKRFLEQSWLVMVSALAFGLLVAGVNATLAPRIEANAREKKTAAIKELLPEALQLETKTTDGVEYTIGTANGQVVGYAITAEGGGFADVIRLVVAVGPKVEEIRGIAVLASNETPGFGDTIVTDWFRDQYIGAPAGSLEVIKTGDASVKDAQIVAITGATISSDAVTRIVNEAVATLRRVVQ